MDPHAPIVTLTMNPAIDLDTQTQDVLPDRKLRCTEPHWDPGGGGINVARAVHQLGGRATALFPCGGHTGTLLRELLDAQGLAYEAIPIAGRIREGMTVTEQRSGQQFRFNLPGPRLSPEEWQACVNRTLEQLPPEGFLVLSGSLPPGVPIDFYARLLAACQRHAPAVRVIVDSSGPAQHAALEHGGIFLIKPNAHELDELAGRPLHDDTERVAVAQALVENNQAAGVIISLGATGSWLVTQQAVQHRYPPPTTVVSRVGAGDSMIAAITLGLARGWSLNDAYLYGLAASTSAVSTPGTALCQRAQTEAWFTQLQQAPVP